MVSPSLWKRVYNFVTRVYVCRRRTLYKQSSNHSGVFGMAGDESFGDSNSRSTKELEDPPVVSLWDIGVNPRKHSSSPDTVKTSNKPVMHSRNAPGKSSLMTQDASSNNNNFLKDSGAAGASIFTPTAPDSQSRKKGGPTIVKVFGYPSGMKVAVIEHFSQCGKVEERYQSGSNWMTFRYESSDAAKEALASHGSIIAKDCMIGVVEAKSMTG
ncbi:hypothetical protein BDB00DRAFT_811021 [Zychaea mexicana]|uniref:uncharacterized protein n=1 Tax=Zychaea mexicana TaxID=64656 RepID=UPI0022FDC6F9|nr:uncharacterized protein BDB00DRAFT_811021 [Zychaea mexicana]KAI9495938.1 hypothetical protein BDB00DRAFT_811021 [Zychaea mexicana]